jgi:hypothetical protein
MAQKNVHDMLDDEGFHSLSGQKNTISIILTILGLSFISDLSDSSPLTNPSSRRSWVGGAQRL